MIRQDRWRFSKAIRILCRRIRRQGYYGQGKRIKDLSVRFWGSANSNGDHGPGLFGDLLLWTPRNFPIEPMVGSLYLALGIIMLAIARESTPHKAFIDYIVIANIFHAALMIVYAETVLQIIIDAGFIGAAGVIPLILYPWGPKNYLRIARAALERGTNTERPRL